MRRPPSSLLLAVLLIAVSAASAQDASVEKNKLLAKRAAEADAYRKLAEAVYGLQLNSRTYVRDFVAESDEIRGEVDTFIKGIRLGRPTWYEDNSCEVPAEVTVAKVVETLRTAHDRHYKGEDIKTADFESLTKRIEKSVIKVIGMGAPRPDIPANLPIGAVEILEPPPSAPAAKPPIPEIWRQVGPQARMMAIRAARMDAARRLAERIKGLRLTSRTQVRDFVAESDEINTELNTKLGTIGEEVSVYLHHDELIAEVTLRIPTEQVITTIKQLHSRRYTNDPDDTSGHDFESVVKTVVKRDFEETGMGVPPEKYLRQYAEQMATRLPEWAMAALTATGAGTDPEMETSQGRLRAARAAEIDAKRKLGEMIAGLELHSRTVLKDFTSEHEEIETVLDAVIAGAVVTRTEFKGDTALVTVSMPGLQIWDVVQEGLRRR